jgi:phage baseplate assembly protein gpV
VKLSANTGLKITLTIPESARGAKDYVARFPDGTRLENDKQTEQTVTVKVPPALLKSGPYAIQLSKVEPDNTERRISGSYYFAVE